MSEERTVLVDVSAFITLAGIGHADVLGGIDGSVAMPSAVGDEIVDGPAVGVRERASSSGWLQVLDDPSTGHRKVPREQLGRDESVGSLTGDASLLGHALGSGDVVIVTDDRPLRKTCKALGIPISGSIGVLIAAVERQDLDPDEAKEALVAMDEVGARLSARLLRKAERLIDEAADERSGD